ncbi:MAG: hypothetical protein IPK91_03735 [Saprospiraceae bacterium]|nr:hypothetical protein [Saprospiraceae bacterium]MBK8296389.1 hypothetical protein [Saprospiraceae bacterium]
MSTTEIVSSILKLSNIERLKIIELIIKTIQDSDNEKLEKATLLMLEDYKRDQNLIDLTVLDLENFYETRGNLAS